MKANTRPQPGDLPVPERDEGGPKPTPSSTVDDLAALITRERESLLSKWRDQVRELPSAQSLDTPTLTDHIPALLNELVAALYADSEATIPAALETGTPPAHGVQRLRDGFDLGEVVAEYDILRGCIHDLADAQGIRLQGKPFHILNRLLSSAVGLAVQAYAVAKALEVDRRREEYLSFVAHDLHTPLNAIALATGILESSMTEPAAGPDCAQMLKTLRRNVENLAALVDNVIKENSSLLSEVGVKIEKRTFELWPLVEALIHDLHPVAGTSSTRLANQIPFDLTVFGDASLLRRIMQNLIANAIEYTPRGEVIIGAKQAEGGIECWVSDNGAGIPADRREKIFDKLETDPEKTGGLGLGLAIVKTFVEAHGGVVTVESTVGSGSTFRFTLPPQEVTT